MLRNSFAFCLPAAYFCLATKVAKMPSARPFGDLLCSHERNQKNSPAAQTTFDFCAHFEQQVPACKVDGAGLTKKYFTKFKVNRPLCAFVVRAGKVSLSQKIFSRGDVLPTNVQSEMYHSIANKLSSCGFLALREKAKNKISLS